MIEIQLVHVLILLLVLGLSMILNIILMSFLSVPEKRRLIKSEYGYLSRVYSHDGYVYVSLPTLLKKYRKN